MYFCASTYSLAWLYQTTPIQIYKIQGAFAMNPNSAVFESEHYYFES